MISLTCYRHELFHFHVYNVWRSYDPSVEVENPTYIYSCAYSAMPKFALRKGSSGLCPVSDFKNLGCTIVIYPCTDNISTPTSAVAIEIRLPRSMPTWFSLLSKNPTSKYVSNSTATKGGLESPVKLVAFTKPSHLPGLPIHVSSGTMMNASPSPARLGF
ncbi:hypothetical protein GOP47_0021286 [Adiantum capillus-veneris]|uniref:Uncharacterized protein n=1 Tax=Adiantum capillus-veneris TaxID=13818 RepID=A0A9D4Z9I2_ADICA|nr:hypothetical protein GOP47_0021286 [Adiantum capillus-veneris]